MLQADHIIEGSMFANHDEYIAASPAELRPLLTQLRSILTKALSDAEEVIRYNMPGYVQEGKVVVGYAAFSKQCGLYVSADAIAKHVEEIRACGLKATKTGVTFSVKKPIPAELVLKLVSGS